MFTQLNFRHPFRKYQRMILEQVVSGAGDHRYHIVAPPGSGKTIVGLELIRYFGQPAVVFSPTTTIQAQWRQKAELFLDPLNSLKLDQLVSLDPALFKPINIYTYQLISTPGQSVAHVREAAIHRWLDDLMQNGQADGPQSAQLRLDTIRQNNPRAYHQELARRYLRIKHDLLGRSGADIAPFLHPNALALIDRLVSWGVRTVVLDECHHLLDYWALVLHNLIARIPDPVVIGLTATLPSPEDDREFENYNGLLGEVDFEVPTPAVVKEGDLAPYRDLVHFVQPTRREVNYLNHIQSAFEQAIAELTRSQSFCGWIAHTILERPTENGERLPWEWFVQRYPLLSQAGVRFLHLVGVVLPVEESLLLGPDEAGEGALTLEDWAVLLERYGLDYLKTSPNPADHQLLKRLREILQPFGLTLTERGLRQGRSPGDLVLAFSESKDRAVADILAAEQRALKDRLRAVIVTDFERMSSGVKQLEGVLDPDAGSALRLFEYLARLPEMDPLCPVLVTGRRLWIDARQGEQLVRMFNDYLRRHNLAAACQVQRTAAADVLEVVGEGKDWATRSYVGMVTEAFDRGLTRCLIGTRGIFGEGWDSLSVNTLIDLTSVTTSTSVQQLRGRSIRKDPAWPRKVAHNWDVVCVAPKFSKGDQDLARFIQRHERYWGIVPLSPLQQVMQDGMSLAGNILDGNLGGSLPPQFSGQIVRGVSHVSPDLAYELGTRGFNRVDYDKYSKQMLHDVSRRDQVYDLWEIGTEYSNFVYSATRLDTSELNLRTAFSLENTLKRMLRQFLASFIAGAVLTCWIAFQIVLVGMDGSDESAAFFGLVCSAVLVLGTLATFILNLSQALRIGQKLLIQQPVDAILLDVGRALLAALGEARLISAHLHPEYVRVVELPDNSYQVMLDYASPEDAAVFVQAYQEIFEPVRDQRYLILRDETRLPGILLSSLWRVLRQLFRSAGYTQPAYHPVPRVLSTRRELAEAFAGHWARYVGGGELVFTRSDLGRKVLLQARAQRRPKVKGLAFQVWR